MVKRIKPVIGVIGAGSCTKQEEMTAEALGQAIAEAGFVLVCGGLSGVMEAVSRGAKSAGGTTIGILPGDSKDRANQYIDFPIATGIGEARNLVIIKTADVLIALPGKYGTLSEMSFALKCGKPLISLSNWEIDERVIKAENPKDAVNMAIEIAGKNN